VSWATSTRKAGLPKDWAKRRLTVLERDGYLCRIRGPECTLYATEVDHAQGRDDHRLMALQAVCRTCHRAKTQAESHADRPARQRKAEGHPGLR
jgi:5-methylcytosine-specific restriction protein A